MKKIAESGQIFRFNVYDDEYSLVAGDKLLFIKEDDDGYILSCSESEFEEFWTDYFDLRLDYSDFFEECRQLGQHLSKLLDILYINLFTVFEI